MARVTGPLMSLAASGSIAGTIVFSNWVGRNYVRQLVTPLNPQSTLQMAVRNALRVAAAGVFWAQRTELTLGSDTDTDKEKLQSAAPADQRWNGYLTNRIIGPGLVTYEAARAAFDDLEPAEKTDWDNAADALTPAFQTVAQFEEFGVPGDPISSGEAFFIYMYGLSAAGLVSAPDDTPPTYS